MTGRPTGRLFSGCLPVTYNLGLAIVKALFRPVLSGLVAALCGIALFFPYARYGLSRPAFVAEYISTLFLIALAVFVFSLWVFAHLLWWGKPGRWLRRRRARQAVERLLQILSQDELGFIHAWAQAGLGPLRLDAGHPLVMSLVAKRAITARGERYAYGSHPHLGWVFLAEDINSHVDRLLPNGYLHSKAYLDTATLIQSGQSSA